QRSAIGCAHIIGEVRGAGGRRLEARPSGTIVPGASAVSRAVAGRVLRCVVMGAETSPSPSRPSAAPVRVPADHPGVAELFAVLAYGEISAFYRLADDARMSPSLQGRVAFASMAAAEMSHFETLHAALT